jgi:Integrase core domain
MLIAGERHLRLVLGEYIDHYNTHRPHRALAQNPPAGRTDPSTEGAAVRVLRRDQLGGLIHEYAQVACANRAGMGGPSEASPERRTGCSVNRWRIVPA